MKLFAFAALLALPLFAVAAPAAKADYYHKKCCGEGHGYNGGEDAEVRYYYVKRPAVVFGCDGWHCKTGIKVKPHTNVKAICYETGWCRIKSHEFKNAWVLKECLILKDEDREENGEGEYEGGES
jgi:hypothetical protein